MNLTEWSGPRSNDRKSPQLKTQPRCSVTSNKDNIGSKVIRTRQSKPVAKDISTARNRKKVRCSTQSKSDGSQNLQNPSRNCKNETFTVKNLPNHKFKSMDAGNISDVKPKFTETLLKQTLKNNDFINIRFSQKLDLPRVNSEEALRIKALEEKLNVRSFELAELQAKLSKLEIDNLELSSYVAVQSEELADLRSWKLKTSTTLARIMPDLHVDKYFDEKKLEMLLNEKLNEVQSSKNENFRLMRCIRNLKDELAIVNLGVGTTPSQRASTGDDVTLETETASFLEKVSNLCRNKSRKIKAHSEDENVKIYLKITVRKEKGEKMLHRLSFEAESPGHHEKTPCQTFIIRDDDSVFVDKVKQKTNKITREARLFTPEEKSLTYPGPSIPCEYSKTSRRCSEIPELFVLQADGKLGIECLDVNLNDNCRPSLGTLDRAEDLDMRLKLKELWNKLSDQGETLERLVEQVNVAKKLLS